MNVLLKKGLVVLVAGHDDEAAELSGWVAVHDGHAFRVVAQDARTMLLQDLGPSPEACREPINVSSRAAEAQVRLISNLAATPFLLHGRSYSSVEGFWQGLKFPDAENRARVARLYGLEAKRAGAAALAAERVNYEGRPIRVGTYEHWDVMHEACWAKFTQHDAALRALLTTGNRPLEHRTRRDSRTIPGVVVADIWMRIRARLRKTARLDAS